MTIGSNFYYVNVNYTCCLYYVNYLLCKIILVHFPYIMRQLQNKSYYNKRRNIFSIYIHLFQKVIPSKQLLGLNTLRFKFPICIHNSF